MDELTRTLRSRIAAGGPLTFAAFMEAALYDPEFGYYSSGRVRFGVEGDFATSPHLGPVFARCVANLAARADVLLGEPEVFTLMEGGPGDGLLAAGVLDRLKLIRPDLYGRILYVADEISGTLSAKRLERLSEHREQLAEAPPRGAVGLYFSNELLDALPFHILELREGGLSEIHVGFEGGRFVEVVAPVSGPEVEALGLETLERIGAGDEFFRFEVCPGIGQWLGRVAGAFTRAVVATVDYGDRTGRLYGPHRPGGSARGYGGGTIHDDLISNPGTIDLTASVDFSAVAAGGASRSFATLPLMNQRDFLFGLGLTAIVEELEAGIEEEAEKMALRLSLHDLLMGRTGMGESFKALLQGIGIGEERLPELFEFP